MNTFERLRKSTGDLFGGEKDTSGIHENQLDDDDQFEFDVPEEAEKKVNIEGAAEAAVESPYEISKVNLTRIGEDTVITGNIETKGHIDILGTVKGNIAAEGNVALRSDIKGNVKGNNIGLGACNVNGDIEASKNILTDPESDITGNIKGSEISVAGQVSGDVKATKMVVLKKDAVMEGDIETDGLVVEPGAIMNGRVSISRKPKKIEPKNSERIPDPIEYETMDTPSFIQPEVEAKQDSEPEQNTDSLSKREKTAVDTNEEVVDVDDADITDI